MCCVAVGAGKAQTEKAKRLRGAQSEKRQPPPARCAASPEVAWALDVLMRRGQQGFRHQRGADRGGARGLMAATPAALRARYMADTQAATA